MYFSSKVCEEVINVLPYDVAVEPSYTTIGSPVVNSSPWTLLRYKVLVPLIVATVIWAPEPFDVLLVVIPKTSPATYPEPPVLLVKLIEPTLPSELVTTVAVAPVPFPVIAYNGTLVYVWPVLNPVPAFVIANVPTGPPICSI